MFNETTLKFSLINFNTASPLLACISKYLWLKYILKFISMTRYMHNMCVLFNRCDLFYYHDICISFVVGLSFETSLVCVTCLYVDYIVFNSIHLTYKLIWLNNLLKSFISKWIIWTFSLNTWLECVLTLFDREVFIPLVSQKRTNSRFKLQHFYIACLCYTILTNHKSYKFIWDVYNLGILFKFQ